MAIDPSAVKKLREETGAGVLDCKKALDDAGGDLDKAREWIRKRGLEIAKKKGERQTKEGRVGHYVHSNAKIGVLVELRCESDFVARTPEFNDLLKELCMQVAGAPTPAIAVAREEIPPETVERKKGEFLNEVPAEKRGSAQMVERIVQGKMEKFFKDSCLLDQLSIRDDSKTVRELLQATVHKLGENISIGRFARIEVGG